MRDDNGPPICIRKWGPKIFLHPHPASMPRSPMASHSLHLLAIGFIRSHPTLRPSLPQRSDSLPLGVSSKLLSSSKTTPTFCALACA